MWSTKLGVPVRTTWRKLSVKISSRDYEPLSKARGKSHLELHHQRIGTGSSEGTAWVKQRYSMNSCSPYLQQSIRIVSRTRAQALTHWNGPHYEVRTNTLTWIKAFLRKIMQEVLLEGVRSSRTNMVLGVTPGTVLGPLFFLAFIDDHRECGHTSHTKLFADD